jgi:purine-nucleoside/S-methyl-5'-thioadenosine phosphorylase / adenosine deaminase
MTPVALPLLRPAWDVPGVGAAMSTREGGVSRGPWASLNLGRSVGDDPAAVAENRRRWAEAIAARPVWLNQVHGVHVLQLDRHSPEHPEQPADAAWTCERGLACMVGAADCLPVLLATADGRAVAAAHAGWRGLAAGVLEATLAALRDGAGAQPAELVAWLGPCIGPRQFEVGADVLQAFGVDPDGAGSPRFRFRPRADGAPRWLADLAGLALERLRRAGVTAVSCADACTVEHASSFFSFRRDGRTGRMAAAVWRR